MCVCARIYTHTYTRMFLKIIIKEQEVVSLRRVVGGFGGRVVRSGCMGKSKKVSERK